MELSDGEKLIQGEQKFSLCAKWMKRYNRKKRDEGCACSVDDTEGNRDVWVRNVASVRRETGTKEKEAEQ